MTTTTITNTIVLLFLSVIYIHLLQIFLQ